MTDTLEFVIDFVWKIKKYTLRYILLRIFNFEYCELYSTSETQLHWIHTIWLCLVPSGFQ